MARWKFNLFPLPAEPAGGSPTSAGTGRTRLTATFRLGPELLNGIREELSRVPKLDRIFVVELVDREGVVHAVVEKTIHVSRRVPSP